VLGVGILNAADDLAGGGASVSAALGNMLGQSFDKTICCRGRGVSLLCFLEGQIC